MEIINRENSKKQLYHDSHSVLNTADGALNAKVEESSFLNFLKRYGFGFVALIIFLGVSYHFWTAINIDNIKYVSIAGQKIKVDLAMTDATREQGLSGRISLGENEGMLFVFDTPDKYGFWMKDMNFPIDIIWIAGENISDMKVVFIKRNAKPELYPESYAPEREAKYVLEVISGFSEKNNLKVGDRIEFVYE